MSCRHLLDQFIQVLAATCDSLSNDQQRWAFYSIGFKERRQPAQFPHYNTLIFASAVFNDRNRGFTATPCLHKALSHTRRCSHAHEYHNGLIHSG